MRKDPGSEDNALQAVEQHHAEMLRRLEALADRLVQAVERRNRAMEHEAKEQLVGDPGTQNRGSCWSTGCWPSTE